MDEKRLEQLEQSVVAYGAIGDAGVFDLIAEIRRLREALDTQASEIAAPRIAGRRMLYFLHRYAQMMPGHVDDELNSICHMLDSGLLEAVQDELGTGS